MLSFLTDLSAVVTLIVGSPFLVVQACKYLVEQYPNSPTRDQVQAFSKAVKVSIEFTCTRNLYAADITNCFAFSNNAAAVFLSLKSINDTQGFELNRTNRLQLINLAPTNLLELLLVNQLSQYMLLGVPPHEAPLLLPIAAEY